MLTGSTAYLPGILSHSLLVATELVQTRFCSVFTNQIFALSRTGSFDRKANTDAKHAG